MRDRDWHPGTRASRRSPCSALVLPAFSMAGGAAVLRDTDLGSGMPTLHHPPPSPRWRPIEACHMQTQKCDLTADRVRELFNYDSHTGLLSRRVSRKIKNPSTKIGWKTKEGYLRLSIDKRCYYAHRIIWLWITGYWPNNEIDHINCQHDDNRIVNLREVDSRMNKENLRGPRSDNKCGLLGVHLRNDTNKYEAKIKAGDKRISLGSFKNKEDAYNAYLSAKRKHHEGNTL